MTQRRTGMQRITLFPMLCSQGYLGFRKDSGSLLNHERDRPSNNRSLADDSHTVNCAAGQTMDRFRGGLLTAPTGFNALSVRGPNALPMVKMAMPWYRSPTAAPRQSAS